MHIAVDVVLPLTVLFTQSGAQGSVVGGRSVLPFASGCVGAAVVSGVAAVTVAEVDDDRQERPPSAGVASAFHPLHCGVRAYARPVVGHGQAIVLAHALVGFEGIRPSETSAPILIDSLVVLGLKSPRAQVRDWTDERIWCCVPQALLLHREVKVCVAEEALMGRVVVVLEALEVPEADRCIVGDAGVAGEDARASGQDRLSAGLLGVFGALGISADGHRVVQTPAVVSAGGGVGFVLVERAFRIDPARESRRVVKVRFSAFEQPVRILDYSRVVALDDFDAGDG